MAAIDELRIPIVLEKVYPSISEEDLKVMGNWRHTAPGITLVK